MDQIAGKLLLLDEGGGRKFYWPAGSTAGADVAFRRPADLDNVRSVDEICEQELRSLARWVLSRGNGDEEAVAEMATNAPRHRSATIENNTAVTVSSGKK